MQAQPWTVPADRGIATSLGLRLGASVHSVVERMPHLPVPETAPRGQGGDPAAFAADLELVRGFVQGKRDRFEELAGRFACLPNMVRALDARIGGNLQEQDLLDIVQDALVRAWSKLDTYAGEARFESWLYGIARFEMLNALRRRKRRRPVEHEMNDVPDRASNEDEGLSELDYEKLHATLQELEPGTVQIMRLKHFEDLTFEQIGRRLGMSPNTAKTRYYRGLISLQSRLRNPLGPDQ